MRLFIVSVALVVFCSGCLEGLNSANPTTYLKLDPISKTMTFHDNKDNDVQIDELEWSGDTKTFKVKKVSIINNASKVREANAVQLQMLALQTQAIMNGIQNIAASLTALVPSSAKGPLGGTVTWVAPVATQPSSTP
jgi:hypothetical protein